MLMKAETSYLEKKGSVVGGFMIPLRVVLHLCLCRSREPANNIFPTA